MIIINEFLNLHNSFRGKLELRMYYDVPTFIRFMTQCDFQLHMVFNQIIFQDVLSFSQHTQWDVESYRVAYEAL